MLALDQGTTSTRAILFDERGGIAASAQREFRQIYPQPGWVEHNPADILGSVYGVIGEAVASGGIDPADIEAMGITNQRETVVVWDSETREPLCNAIVWQCRRTAQDCRALCAEGKNEAIYRKTGLRPDAYFSATKLRWILEHVPAARAAAEKGRLRAGTVDTYLLYCLSGGRIFATDCTNASRTMLYDIHRRDWDDELLSLFSLRREMLPAVFPSGHMFGTTSREILGREIPICGVAGDQQAALYGQRCTRRGGAKCTFGTGCFLLCNTGRESVASRHGLLTTLAADEEGKPVYALEGSVFTGGAAVQWLRDEMRLIRTASESEQAALAVPDSGGVYVVPAFVGLGAPYWDSDARGTICGITRGTSREHIVRATLESVAYQCYDVLKAMTADTGLRFARLAVDGGASANNFLMQFLADITGAEIVRPRVVETTALGVAMLAAKTHGGRTAVMSAQPDYAERIFVPQIGADARDKLLEGWHTAVSRARWQGHGFGQAETPTPPWGT